MNQKKIKICHIITDLYVGGAEMMLYKLLSNQNEFECIVVSLMDGGPISNNIKELGISLYSLGMTQGKIKLKSIIALIKVIRKERPDLIQGWMYHGNILSTIVFLVMIFSRKIPVLWNVRQSLYSLRFEKRLTKIIINISKYLSKIPRSIIYNSQTSAIQHENLGFNKSNRVIISNGFDTNVFKPSKEAKMSLKESLGLPSDSKIIGLICRYHPMKDHINFIRAAQIVAHHKKNVYFLMVGHDVNNENLVLSNEIERVGMIDFIMMLGERKDVPQITAGLDIACSSSYAEGFPNVIGEAMACSIPCVVTDVGDSKWILDTNGKVVPPNNSEELAEGIISLLNMNEEELSEIGKCARKRVIENFSIKSVVNDYAKLYYKVLEGKVRN